MTTTNYPLTLCSRPWRRRPCGANLWARQQQFCPETLAVKKMLHLCLNCVICESAECVWQFNLQCHVCKPWGHALYMPHRTSAGLHSRLWHETARQRARYTAETPFSHDLTTIPPIRRSYLCTQSAALMYVCTLTRLTCVYDPCRFCSAGQRSLIIKPHYDVWS